MERLCLLDSPHLEAGGARQELLPSKPIYLLIYLAYQQDWVKREGLAGLFWPDSPEDEARHNLRVTLHRAKAQPWASGLEVERTRVRWAIPTDVEAFKAAIGQGDWATASGLHRRPFLEGLPILDTPGFEEWASLEREGLLEAWYMAALHHAEVLQQARNHAEASTLLAELLRSDLLAEEVLQQYLRAASLAGQREAALKTYERFTQQLQAELGLEPTPITQELALRLRSAQPLEASRPQHNLPPQSTRFVGRRRELALLNRQLSNPDCRLLTLVGLGGMGKTRLALELAAQQLEGFADGVWWVPLAGVDAPDLLAPSIAAALGFAFSGSADPKTQLFNYLRNKELLLVLDNFEQLLAGAALLEELTLQAPALKLLLTSRVALELSNEWLHDLEGLVYPPADTEQDLDGFDAVRLFIQRAERHSTAFSPGLSTLGAIAELCRKVQGMPLALELAATWTRGLSVEELLGRLSQSFVLLQTHHPEVPQRQRSLQVILNYSWGLLSEAECGVLAGLSVFRGGFTLEAAEQVAEAHLGLVLRLINQALLRRSNDGRYDMHELVRQFAEEKLGSGSEGTEDRHANYFSSFLAALDTELGTGHFDQATQAIAAESANVRQALERLLQQQRWSILLVGLSSYSHFLNARGLFREAEAWFAHVVEASKPHTEESALLLRARAESLLGLACMNLGQTERARALFEQCLPTLKQHRHLVGMISTYHNLGMLWVYMGDYAKAEHWYRQSLRLNEEMQDIPGIANTLNSLGTLYCIAGKLTEGIECFRRGLGLIEDMGNRHTSAHLYANIGVALREMGDIPASETALRKASQLAEAIQHWRLFSTCLGNLAEVSFIQGNHDAARQLRQQGLALARRLGYRRNEAVCLVMMGYDASRLGQPDEARQHFLEGLALAQALSHKDIMLNALIGLAELDMAADQNQASLTNLIFAAEHPSTQGEARGRAKKLLQTIEAQVSAQTFASAQQQAQTLELEQLVAGLLASK